MRLKDGVSILSIICSFLLTSIILNCRISSIDHALLILKVPAGFLLTFKSLYEFFFSTKRKKKREQN